MAEVNKGFFEVESDMASEILKIIGINFPVSGFEVIYDVNDGPIRAKVYYYPSLIKVMEPTDEPMQDV